MEDGDVEPIRPPARVLITGSTTGIGRATAELFAVRGYEVGILSFSAAEVEETVEHLREAGGLAYPVVADFSQPGEAAGLIDRLEEEWGPIEILVNNAGIGLQADVVDTRDEDLRRLFEVNFFAAFILSRDALRQMAKRDRGLIINISSASARRSLPGLSVYAATKAAMHALSQSLRIEAHDSGVRVTEILPTSVSTPFFANATNRAGHRYAAHGQLLTPQQLAAMVLRAVEVPHAEMYTSSLLRLGLALDSYSPKVTDTILLARRREQQDAHSNLNAEREE